MACQEVIAIFCKEKGDDGTREENNRRRPIKGDDGKRKDNNRRRPKAGSKYSRSMNHYIHNISHYDFFVKLWEKIILIS